MASVDPKDPVPTSGRPHEYTEPSPGSEQSSGILGAISSFINGSRDSNRTGWWGRRASNDSTFSNQSPRSRGGRISREKSLDTTQSNEQRPRFIPGIFSSSGPQERGMQMGGAVTYRSAESEGVASRRQRANSHSSLRRPSWLGGTAAARDNQSDRVSISSQRSNSTFGGIRRPHWVNVLDVEYHPDTEHAEHDFVHDTPEHPSLSVLEDPNRAPADPEAVDIFRRRPSAELRSLASAADRGDSASVYHDAQSIRDGQSIRSFRPSDTAPVSEKVHDESDESIEQKSEVVPEAKPDTTEGEDIKIVYWDGVDDKEHPLVCLR